MTSASVHEALDVIARTAGWLARGGNAARARYVEATLMRWAERPVEPDVAEPFARIRARIAGFDAEPAEARQARASEILAEIEALRAVVGGVAEAETGPRVVLLPAGISSDLPPRPPPVPQPVAAPAPEVEAPAEAPPEERREARREERREERREGREDRRREREGRRDETRRGERREEREARGERGERREEREARGERGERREEREARREEAAPEAAPEAPRVEAPPEPRTFPLGHPEASGEDLEVLGVLAPEEIEALAAAGVTSGADLLLRAPTKIERAGERWIPGVTPEGAVIVRGTVKRRSTRFGPGWRRHEIVLAHDKGDVRCVWIGDVPVEVTALRPGAEAGFAGRLEVEEEVPVLYEGEPLGIDGRGGDWLPAYGVAGVPDARVRAAVRAALRKYADSLQDHLSPELLERYRLLPLAAALRDAHFPSNANRKGRSRLGFDELLQVQLGVALLRQREPRGRGVSNPVSHAWIAQAQGMLGHAFSDDQEAAFDDIRRDLRRNQPMQRLLQGDVGVGKHAIVQAAMMLVAEAKHQAVFVAPDALTAEHRFLFAEAFFKTVGIEPMLLVGAPTRAQQESIRKGDTTVIYATQSILQSPPQFRRLGLVVFEEHGPYGAAEVAAFESQGGRPDMLVFTPTPVPSAIALNLYGALAMTVIPPAPARGVETQAFDAQSREQAYALARQAIEDGEQVMVVFPMLRGQDLLSPSEARRLAEVLAQETFPGARIGIFNGGMSREERYRAYDDFQHRRTDVLLATTYVEHGPAVPQASVMIVEQAQQYDLVRLHRLRGHVAFGWKRGKCLLVIGDDPRPEARRAIDLLLEETDGFRIAELDLRQRGVEAVLGERAAEAPDFAWADPVEQRDLLVRTRQEAMRLLAQDPGLRRRSNRALVHLVRARFGDDVLPEAAGTTPGAEPSGGPSGGRGRRRRRRGR